MVPLLISSDLVNGSDKGLVRVELGQYVLASVLELVWVEGGGGGG